MRSAPRLKDNPQPVLDYLSSHAGLVFPESRHGDIAAGICRVMAQYGIGCTDEFVRLIAADEAIFDVVIAEVTVGETYFFREPAQFDAIRNTVLPSLLQARNPMDAIRVWSAGCASGEEAYSLAILMEQEGLSGRAKIRATDISRAALRKARRAEYSSWSLRGEVGRRLDPRPRGFDGLRMAEERQAFRGDQHLDASRYPGLTADQAGAFQG